MGLFIRKYYKSCIIAIIILLLSVLKSDNLPENPLINFPFADKIAHFVMYAVFSFFLLEDFGNSSSKKLHVRIWIPVILAVFFGLFMESLQLLSGHRSAETLDGLFNIFGSLFGLVVFSGKNYIKELLSAYRP
jgi:VanZ family protein